MVWSDSHKKCLKVKKNNAKMTHKHELEFKLAKMFHWQKKLYLFKDKSFSY